MAKADLLKQVAEANQKIKDVKSILKAKPVKEGNYVAKIADYTVNNNRVSVKYALTDEDSNTYNIRESYSLDSIDMFLDKLAIIATIYNTEKGEEITTERGIDELINFEYAANVTQRINDQYINWNVTPFPPKKED